MLAILGAAFGAVLEDVLRHEELIYDRRVRCHLRGRARESCLTHVFEIVTWRGRAVVLVPFRPSRPASASRTSW